MKCIFMTCLLMWTIITPQCFAMNISKSSGEEYPQPICDIQLYPESVQLGDMVYLRICMTNPHDRAISVSSDFWRTVSCENMVRLTAINPQTQERFPIREEMVTNETSHIRLRYKKILPQSKSVVYMVSFCLPALEDIEDIFWKKYDNLSQKQTIDIEVCLDAKVYTVPFNPNNFYKGRTEKTVTLKLLPRNSQESQKITQWYANTHREYFPNTRGVWCKSPSKAMRSIGGNHHIHIRNEVYSSWNFVRTGNRYPGDPNCPETWQGWKELEESLTPSTMRDEIRMTRIVIQYLDTEDSKVLDELTEWLQNMNEIQRIVMVQNVMNLEGRLSQDEKISTPINKLIETVQPFAAETSTEPIQ